MVENGLQRTGYDEVALTSLSSADYSGIDTLVGDLINEQSGCGNVGLSLPSLRVDAFTVGVASQIQKVRRTGLTFAPEGGSWRIRQVINKLITEEDLYTAVDAAFSQGWRRVKLYFLVGLPTEMDEDTLGIAELARQVVNVGRKHTKQASCTVSVGGFVPKPHTPFQWFGQNGSQELQRKIWLLRDDLKRTQAQGEVARPGGDVRRRARVAWRPPDRSRHRAGVARRRDVPGVERALPPRPLDGGDGGRGSRPGLVRHPAPHRRTRSCRGTTSRRGCTRTSSGRTGRPRWPSTGSPIAGGPRATTAGYAPTTRIEHIVASPVPPAGGSQGTGQDLSQGHTSRSSLGSSGREGRARVPGAGEVLEARQGALRRAPGRGPGVRAGVPHREPSDRVHAGVLAPAPGELRARVVGRPRVGCRVPGRRAGRAGRRRRLGAAHRRVAGGDRRSSAPRRWRTGHRHCKRP